MKLQFDSLQFALFVNGRPKSSAIELWAKAFDGGLPENFQQIPTGGTQAGGRSGAFNVLLQSQPGRIDVIVTPIDSGVVVRGKPQAAQGDFEPGENLGSAVMSKLWDGEDIHRAAVVFQSSVDCATAEEAVNRVAAWAPVRYPGSTVDLYYQVTVPFQSEVDRKVTGHKLVRWSTGQKVTLRIDTTTGLASNQERSIVAGKYVDVYITEQIERSLIKDHLQELVKVAGDILDRGYDAVG